MSNTRPITLHAPRRHHVRWVSLRKDCEWCDGTEFRWMPDFCRFHRGTDTHTMLQGCGYIPICPIKDKLLCPRLNGGLGVQYTYSEEIIFGSRSKRRQLEVKRIHWDRRHRARPNPHQALIDESMSEMARYVREYTEGDKR